MTKSKKMPWPDNLPTLDRLAGARERLEKILDLTISLVHLHEHNREAFYTDVLHKQIPLSYAGVAYKVFANSMESMEIIRVCRLWDKASADRISLPSIREMLADAAVTDLARQERLASEPGRASRIAEDHNAMQVALAEIDTTVASDLCKSLKHYRDYFLAHTLIEDPAKTLPARARRGHERQLLEKTIDIIDALNLALRSSDFDWKGAHNIARDNARELWQNCAFNIPNYAK